MSPATLTGIALVVSVLAALVLPRRLAVLLAVGLCIAATALVVLYLASGAPPASLALPIGLPGAPITLAIDGLSGLFLLLLLPGGAAALAASLAEPDRSGALLPVLLAALVFTVLAGDGHTLVLTLAVAGMAGAALLIGEHDAAALLLLRVVMLAVLSLALALAVAGDGPGFSALRSHPPEGWRAAAMLTLTVAGAGTLAGLAPLHGWLPIVQAAAPGPTGALLAGGLAKLGLYVLVRLLFDLAGPAQPLWWGMVLLLMGAAGALYGGLRATQEMDIKALPAAVAVAQIGMTAIGLGVALAARAVDIAPLAALALGGALLCAVVHGWMQMLLALVAGAVTRGAGTRRLNRLGGLVHRMRFTTIAVLVGGLGLAALPPGAGFAGTWVLMQALILAPRIGGLDWLLLTALVAAALGLAGALLAVAAVRLVGVGFLGRPRSPRAAAADEVLPALRWAMLGLAGLTGLAGLFPGVILRLADPALRLLTGVGMAAHAGLLGVAPAPQMAGYAAPGIALLLAAAVALTVVLVRARSPAGHRSAAAWDGGSGPAPPRLPFGDPATQIGAAGFARTVHDALGRPTLAARWRLPAGLRRRIAAHGVRMQARRK